MSDALLQVAVGLTVFTLLIAIPAAAFLKFFARPLTWGQALIVSIFCWRLRQSCSLSISSLRRQRAFHRSPIALQLSPCS